MEKKAIGPNVAGIVFSEIDNGPEIDNKHDGTCTRSGTAL